MPVLLIVLLLLLNELDVEFRALLECVLIERPAGYDSQVVLASLELDYEVSPGLLHSLLQVLDELRGVLAEVNVDTLCLRLQDAVLVPQNEAHAK